MSDASLRADFEEIGKRSSARQLDSAIESRRHAISAAEQLCALTKAAQ